jgi:hypothetical protein
VTSTGTFFHVIMLVISLEAFQYIKHH